MWTPRAATVAACSWLLACSSSDSTPASSKRLVDLSPPEVASLCDSLAQIGGGYGHTTTCHQDASVTTMVETPKDQATCEAELAQLVSGAPTCPATVAQATACNEELVDCSRQGAPAPDCQTLDACSTPDTPGGGGSGGSSSSSPGSGGGSVDAGSE